jgi:AcrR family transcriptional regulator
VEPENGNRTRLVAVGTHMFETRGYRHVSIQDIADAVGISVGSFYTYFNSKESLYTSIVYQLEKDGIERTIRIVSRYHSPLNKIRALYRLVTLGVRRNRILRGILLQDRNYLSPEILNHIAGDNHIRNHVENLVSEIIREGAMRNTFRTGLYRNASFLVSALFDTILKNLDSELLPDLVEDLLTLIERGLKRRLRLRRRPERLDRRMLRNADDDDDEFLDL